MAASGVPVFLAACAIRMDIMYAFCTQGVVLIVSCDFTPLRQVTSVSTQGYHSPHTRGPATCATGGGQEGRLTGSKPSQTSGAKAPWLHVLVCLLRSGDSRADVSPRLSARFAGWLVKARRCRGGALPRCGVAGGRVARTPAGKDFPRPVLRIRWGANCFPCRVACGFGSANELEKKCCFYTVFVRFCPDRGPGGARSDNCLARRVACRVRSANSVASRVSLRVRGGRPRLQGFPAEIWKTSAAGAQTRFCAACQIAV